MKVVSPLILLTCCAMLATPVLAAETKSSTPGCDAKRESINEQIKRAKDRGNTNEIAGLNKAFEENKANCTEKGLLREHQNKVLDAKADVAKRETKLEEAKKKGKPEKIEKRKEELNESIEELNEAKRELEDLQDLQNGQP
jgi:DNA repair exonuclease SbcCD ATPase subunit